MNRQLPLRQIQTLRTLLLLCLALFATSFATAADSSPNVLLILADDLGYSDLGCYGSEIQTPHLDGLAASGLQFTNFYNTARCWPTRSSLMTGFYPQQIGRDSLPTLPGGNGSKRPAWAKLLPEMLKPAGYRSYHTGKWHIDSMPIATGFDRSYYLKDQGRFFNPTKHFKDDQPLPPVPKDTGYYGTTALADHVIEVLQEHQRDHNDKPFFQYLAFAAPHFPLHALPDDIAVYQETYTVGWDVIRQQRWRQMQALGLLGDSTSGQLSRPERDLGPPYHFANAFEVLGPGEINRPLPWKNLSQEQQSFQAKKMAIHAAMIHRMDIEIGRVLDQIRDMDRFDNTLVLFLSDNGASAEIMVRDDGHDPTLSPGSAGTYLCLGPGWSTVCNTPFRRHKTWTHEGGISTPLIVSLPASIQSDTANTAADKTQRNELRHTPGHVIDIVPTLIEICGGQSIPGAPPLPGKSLTGVFEKDISEFHDSIWWMHDGHRAIQTGKWKAVSPIGEPWELYDLSYDRRESTDLAVPHADRLRSMIQAWEAKTEQFTRDAISDGATRKPNGRSKRMNQAQQDALPQRTQVLLQAETFRVRGRHAFLMKPTEDQVAKDSPADHANAKPWIFYAPTLKNNPDQAESWMHQQFLDAGVAVAGIDVGEGYGSPHAIPFLDALYDEMIRRGYSKTPALLGRSRGGLWASSWAIKHPERVAGLGGIYPVYDYTTYPGVKRAATAYATTPGDLHANQNTLNPVKQLSVLADNSIPVCIIHGTDDKVVPIDANSLALKKTYDQAGQSELVELIQVEGQGHNFWEGFFHCPELVSFLIEKAKAVPATRRP